MITLINGAVQNAAGMAQPNGSIVFQLNMNATVVADPGGFVVPEPIVTLQCDSTGSLVQPARIYSNAELNPQNATGLATYYLVTFYDANGARLNKVPMWWQFTQSAGSTVDISKLVPVLTVGGNVIFYPQPIFTGQIEPQAAFLAGPPNGTGPISFRPIQASDLPGGNNPILASTFVSYRLSGFDPVFPARGQGLNFTIGGGTACVNGTFVTANPISQTGVAGTTYDFWLQTTGDYKIESFPAANYTTAPVHPDMLHIARVQALSSPANTVGMALISNDTAMQSNNVDNANYLGDVISGPSFIQNFWMQTAANYTNWTASTAVTTGQILKTSTGRLYQVAISGTTGLTEPTIQFGPTPPNFYVIDGTVSEIFFGLATYAQMFRYAKHNSVGEYYFQNIGLTRACKVLTGYVDPINGGAPQDLMLPYIKGVVFNVCHARQNSFAYQLGQKMFAKQSSGNSWYWLCTGAGTSAGSSPFTTAHVLGDVVTDGSAQFTCVYQYFGNGTNVDWVWLDLADDWVTYRYPDSHDSYAATFLSLVKEYISLTGNAGWLTTTSSQAGLTYAQVLAQIATQNLTSQLNAPATGVNSNSINTFQATIAPWDGSIYNVNYFEDNCEDYRGLMDGAYIFNLVGDSTTANACTTAAASVVTGLTSLFGTSNIGNQFFVYYFGAQTDPVAGWNAVDAVPAGKLNWYPYLQPQLFAELCGVPLPSYMFTAVRQFTAMKWPSYWADAQKDTFPNNFLGYLAATKWQDAEKANEALFNSAQIYSGIQAPGYVNQGSTMAQIDEFGYYLATKAALAQPTFIEVNGVPCGRQDIANLTASTGMFIVDRGDGGIVFSTASNVAPVVAVSSVYTTSPTDFLILASGTFTVTLRTAGVPVGQLFAVKNAGSGTITVAGQTGNIDGNASITLAAKAVARVSFDGSNFWQW